LPDPITRVDGKVADIEADDVDTDQILPAEFLKVTEKAGLSKYLFYRWRYDASGKLTGNFVLDRPEYADASVLLAGRNFGIGSSRENAVWALLDRGIKCVIASSFGDIFYNNAAKNGLLCIRIPDTEILHIRNSIFAGWPRVSVDLQAQTIYHVTRRLNFEIEPHIKERLLSGMDDIALTTANYLPQIEGYEKSMRSYLKPRQQKS
jgi:3-isopropylmalate/(R)-2-methylmalate dehydratase small subunit